jgi:hypothetical protein
MASFPPLVLQTITLDDQDRKMVSVRSGLPEVRGRARALRNGTLPE